MIICPLLSNGYYSMVIHSIIERAREYGYTTFVAQPCGMHQWKAPIST